MEDAPINVNTIDLNFLGQANGIGSFLVESAGTLVLVETGPHSTFPHLKTSIEALGYNIEDIKHVLLTHIHLDHAGAAWCFAEHGAKIYLHPFGFRHMNDPSKLLASAKMIYKEAMDSLWGTLNPIPSEQLIQVEHNEIVTIDHLEFKSLHTPGHAKHHIAWRLDDFIFTGDVGGVSINGGPVIPPCPPPDINMEDWFESISTLEKEEGIMSYYLTHMGRVDDIYTHNEALRTSLRSYSEFVKPYAAQNASVPDMLPDFREFVQQYLIDNGMQKSDAMAYEAANPSDMSATGLLRYWHKKWEQN